MRNSGRVGSLTSGGGGAEAFARWIYRSAAALAWVFLLLFLLSPPVAFGADTAPDSLAESSAAPPKTVLIVYSFHEEMPWQNLVRQGLTESLAAMDAPLTVLEESLDAGRFPGPDHTRSFAEYLTRKYADRVIDVVVTESEPAAELLAGNPGLFDGVPHLYVNPSQSVAERVQHGLEGSVLSVRQDIIASFRAMLDVSGARRVAVVGETATPLVRQTVQELRDTYPSTGRGVRVSYLLDLPMADLLRRVRELPSDSAVFYVLIFQDGAGQRFIPFDAVREISAQARVPVFSHWDSLLGSGIVGGYMLSGTQVGRLAARDIGLLLSGRTPASQFKTPRAAFAHMYDWRALTRTGLDMDRLPPGNDIQYREPTFWSEYRYEAIAAGLLFLTLSALIAMLVFALAQRRRALAALEQQRSLLEERVEVRTAELTQAEARLSEAQRIAHIGNWDWHIDVNTLWWSDEIYRIFGVEPQAFPATYDAFLAHVHPDDRDRVQKGVEDALSQTRPYNVTHRIVTPDGVEKYVHEFGEVTRNETGAPVRMIGTVQDITEQVCAEQQMVEAKEAAEKASQAKSEFLASMSHELRTPLNAILGFGQMLQIDKATPLSEKQHDYVRSILDGGDHLLELVNQILDLAKIEAHQAPLSLEAVSANEVVAECIAFTAPIGQSRGIQVFDHFSGGHTVELKTDRLRFKQALLNLLSNAVKYNVDGGNVDVYGRETESGFLRISVVDTGIGIAKEDFGNVFQMFHRLGDDPMVAREGTGIGLVVSKLLIERMAGRIGFDSEKGVGTTFWFELPLASNTQAIIWGDTLRIGIGAIDDDHRQIIESINKLTYRTIDDKDIDEVMDGLLDYAHNHFLREEAVMEACGYPDLENHRAFHADFGLQIDDLAKRWRETHDLAMLDRFREFLSVLWIDHILREDVKIAGYTEGKKRQIDDALRALESENGAPPHS